MVESDSGDYESGGSNSQSPQNHNKRNRRFSNEIAFDKERDSRVVSVN